MANKHIGTPISADELKGLNQDETTAKHTAKDSVFVDVFSDKDNILDAYKEFHPEDTTTTADDIWVSTLKTILILWNTSICSSLSESSNGMQSLLKSSENSVE